MGTEEEITELVLIQGEKWPLVLWEEDEAGILRDLTGCTVRCQIRPSAGSTTIIAAFACSLANDPVTGYPNRYVNATLTATETAALPPGKYWIECEIVPGGLEANAEKLLPPTRLEIKPEVIR